MIKPLRLALRFCATVAFAALASGCTLLTFSAPNAPEPLPFPVLTASDAALVQGEVGAHLSGQSLQFGKMVAGSYYTSTRYKFITAFTVCGAVSSGSGAQYAFLGYLSRERGTFEIAGIAHESTEREAIVSNCIKNRADFTARETPS